MTPEEFEEKGNLKTFM